MMKIEAISTVGFATLPQRLRVQGATVSNLIRSVGGSIGISALQVILVNNMQVARAGLVRHIRPDNPAVQQMMPHGPTPQALGAINGMVMRQAALISYVDDFWLMAIIMVLLLPILFFMRSPKQSAAAAAATPVME